MKKKINFDHSLTNTCTCGLFQLGYHPSLPRNTSDLVYFDEVILNGPKRSCNKVGDHSSLKLWGGKNPIFPNLSHIYIFPLLHRDPHTPTAEKLKRFHRDCILFFFWNDSGSDFVQPQDGNYL